jgi:hypothetical protein
MSRRRRPPPERASVSSSPRVRDEHLGVGQEQQQLGADEGADDDVDAEVEDAVGVEASCFRPHHRQLQAEQIRAASRTP